MEIIILLGIFIKHAKGKTPLAPPLPCQYKCALIFVDLETLVDLSINASTGRRALIREEEEIRAIKAIALL